MQDTPLSHADIMNLWTGPRFLQRCADDLDLPKCRIRQWRERDSIPPRYWPRVIAVVREVHGIEITEAQMTAAAVARAQDCDARRHDEANAEAA